jgi:hypothetical protein
MYCSEGLQTAGAKNGYVRGVMSIKEREDVRPANTIHVLMCFLGNFKKPRPVSLVD